MCAISFFIHLYHVIAISLPTAHWQIGCFLQSINLHLSISSKQAKNLFYLNMKHILIHIFSSFKSISKHFGFSSLRKEKIKKIHYILFLFLNDTIKGSKQHRFVFSKTFSIKHNPIKSISIIMEFQSRNCENLRKDFRFLWSLIFNLLLKYTHKNVLVFQTLKTAL